jgi:hypothetical protein
MSAGAGNSYTKIAVWQNTSGSAWVALQSEARNNDVRRGELSSSAWANSIFLMKLQNADLFWR